MNIYAMFALIICFVLEAFMSHFERTLTFK